MTLTSDLQPPAFSLFSLSEGREAGDVARERRLPGVCDARQWQQPPGGHPPGEQTQDAEPLPQEQGSGAVRVLPPHQAVFLRGHAALCASVQPHQTGAHQETDGQLQMDFKHGHPSRRYVTGRF